MKMTKLMAALVVVTIMMTSVVFGATTATTTTYDVDTLTGVATFDVETIVTGLNADATKLTYVLYNGAEPDEDNIIYIDQKDGSSEHTFTVNDIPVDKFIGSDVIANDNLSDDAYTEVAGDVYKLTKGSMPGVSYVTFTDANGGVYDFDKNGVTYLPIGVNVTATFFTAAGTGLASASQGAVALSTSGNTAQLASNYAVNQVVELTATVTDAEAGSFIAVDEDAIIDTVNNTVTFLVSSTGVADVKLIGLNVTISGNINTTLPDLRNTSNNETFGIQITDTNELGLVDGNEFDVTVSYDGNALELVAGTNYYEVK